MRGEGLGRGTGISNCQTRLGCGEEDPHARKLPLERSVRSAPQGPAAPKQLQQTAAMSERTQAQHAAGLWQGSHWARAASWPKMTSTIAIGWRPCCQLWYLEGESMDANRRRCASSALAAQLPSSYPAAAARAASPGPSSRRSPLERAHELAAALLGDAQRRHLDHPPETVAVERGGWCRRRRRRRVAAGRGGRHRTPGDCERERAAPEEHQRVGQGRGARSTRGRRSRQRKRLRLDVDRRG